MFVSPDRHEARVLSDCAGGDENGEVTAVADDLEE